MVHYKIQVNGIVQGVGFRPFVYALATGNNCKGSVINNTEGVTIHLEGDEQSIQQCIDAIKNSPPPLAKIIDIRITKLPLNGYTALTRPFHTQPNACRGCGPEYRLCDSSGKTITTQFDAIMEQVKALLKDHIVAIKSVGGYHLACDARSDRCVTLLRERKNRPFKPFAIMVSTIEFLETFCSVTAREKELLQSRDRPIVLVKLNKTISASCCTGFNLYRRLCFPTPFPIYLFHNNRENHLIRQRKHC
jgi:hydrogenase maturation factor HypF (carbamoyltransferase family)